MTRPTLFTDCTVATMESGRPSYGLIEDAAILQRDGLIEWVGRSGAVPGKRSEMAEQSLQGRLVTPALIDCHTHLVFGGNRAKEFEQRLQGVSYEEIARSGGGINSTVESTRTASFEALVSASLRRLDDLISDGVAVVEVKSGYGLTIEDEIRMLRVARKLEALRPVKIVTTWLAAHALPPAFKNRPDDYIDEVAIPGLVRAAEEGLVDAVDGFCETIGFSPAQIERVFQAAASLGLPVKLHAEQLSDSGGAQLAASVAALSADHLEYVSTAGLEAMAGAGIVAVLLPGAYYALRETRAPPVAAMRRLGVPMAVATDCNPGTSPCASPLLMLNMACTLFGLAPDEALAGMTRHAARALGLHADRGRLAVGLRADFALWDVAHPRELAYWIGGRSCVGRVVDGVPVEAT